MHVLVKLNWEQLRLEVQPGPYNFICGGSLNIWNQFSWLYLNVKRTSCGMFSEFTDKNIAYLSNSVYINIHRFLRVPWKLQPYHCDNGHKWIIEKLICGESESRATWIYNQLISLDRNIQLITCITSNKGQLMQNLSFRLKSVMTGGKVDHSVLLTSKCREVMTFNENDSGKFWFRDWLRGNAATY